MGMRWVQNPAIPGDAGKRYVTDAKAAMLAGSEWMETTQPAGVSFPVDDVITRSELEAALVGAGVTIPDADPATRGKARLMAGTADDPLYPASRIFGQLQDLQISSAIARVSALTQKADLDGTGKVPQGQLPAVALTEHLGAVASQAAMLALAGQRGDWCTRTDLGTDWQLIAEPSSSLPSWRQMTYPASPVSSVAGRTGAVTLARGDVGLGQVDNTPDSGKPVSTAQQSALDGKAAVAHGHTSAGISDFVEAVQDAVAQLLGAGSNVVLDYNDAAGTLTVSAAGGGGSGLDAEAVRDAIGVALVGVGRVAVAVNDAADTITISTTATQNSTDEALRDRDTHTGEQPMESVTGLLAALEAKLAAGDARLAEAVQGTVAAMLTAGSGIELDYDDQLGLLAISATGGSTPPPGPGAGFATAAFATSPFGGSA